MTDYQKYPERTRDIQDGTERHVWGEQEYLDGAGSIVRVRGTDTEDQEATVLNIGGVSFNLPRNSNTEVVLLAGGSDTNQKWAILTIPRDKQRKWAEGTGGVQNPTDPTKAVEFNGKRTWLTEDNAAIGSGGAIEVIGNTIYLRGDVSVSGNLSVTGDLTVQGLMKTRPPIGPENVTVPGFEP